MLLLHSFSFSISIHPSLKVYETNDVALKVGLVRGMELVPVEFLSLHSITSHSSIWLFHLLFKGSFLFSFFNFFYHHHHPLVLHAFTGDVSLSSCCSCLLVFVSLILPLLFPLSLLSLFLLFLILCLLSSLFSSPLFWLPFALCSCDFSNFFSSHPRPPTRRMILLGMLWIETVWIVGKRLISSRGTVSCFFLLTHSRSPPILNLFSLFQVALLVSSSTTLWIDEDPTRRYCNAIVD